MSETPRRQVHSGPVLDDVNGYQVIECVACGFRHITPIPSPEELEPAYRDQYYSVEKPLYIERFREDLDWWNLVYGERYDTLEALLAPERRNILDVGAGPGFFLLHGVERGWQATGVEPATAAAAHCRSIGVTVIERFFTDDLVPELGTFDAVHMSEVLEHIPDPKAMLQRVHRVLSPGGIISIAIPNDYNPFQDALRREYGYEPWWVAPPHHINYFDFDSIEGLLKTSGFAPVLRESTFPIDMFLLMGDNYVGNDSLGRACHQRRKQFEQGLTRAGLGELKRRLYRELASLGIGRECVIFARRTSPESE